MIELIFSACLIASPADCKEVHLTFAEPNVTPMACMFVGQVHMAEWLTTNPKWRPGRYRCAPVREAKIEI
jgi:predicted unusual protein kinase regulating ubiquinone biosynthesis (AarF/ABC1/UbiB family)